MAYTVPQLLISQEFSQIQTFSQSPLSALIIGPDKRQGAITALALGTAGSGYYAATIAVSDTDGSGAVITTGDNFKPLGAITSITVSVKPAGYTAVPTVEISDSTGKGAELTAVLGTDADAGKVVSFVVVSGGAGYSSGTTITLVPTDEEEGATQGTLVVNRSTGAMTSYKVVNGGSNYSASATFTVTPAALTVDGTTFAAAGTLAAPGTASFTSSYAIVQSLVGEIGVVNNVEDIETAFGSSYTTPSNPLAFALYQAVLNANNTGVYYAAVSAESVNGYNAALILSEKSNAYYGIVPLSQDPDIFDAVTGHVNNMSDPKQAKWRVAWFSPAQDGSIQDYIDDLPDPAVSNANENTGPRRLHYVFPDTYYVNATTTAPGYILAASLAALRGGSVPHQSLTNTQLIGPYYLEKCVATLSETELDELAGSGTWIVTQKARGGTAYTRHQVTGDSTGLNYREDSITANVDSISYGLQESLEPYVGVYNITPGTLLKMKATIDAELSYRMTNTFTNRAGNQLIGYEIVSVKQDTTQSDKVIVVVRLQVPYPMNYITVSLSI
jgi:hypothetical protein